jgi:ribonucleoside-triphosphate reductase
MNIIGKCVIAGNIRRVAEIALGSAFDKDFIELKDYTKNPDR